MGNGLKASLFLLAFLLTPVLLPAQDDYRSFGDGIFGDGVFGDGTFGDGTNFPQEPSAATEGAEEPETPEKQEPQEKKKFRVKNRMVELSIANTTVGFANNFVAVSDAVKDPVYLLKNINDIVDEPGLVWKDPIDINLDNFFDGFNLQFGAAIKPIAINFNWKDRWGFGLDIAHVDISGNLSLSGNLVTVSEADEDKFGVGGAVFVDTAVPVFFHYGDFKIKWRPAVYVPVIYTEPKITYTYTNVTKQIGNETVEGTRYEISYDMKIYSLVSMEGTDGGLDAITKGLSDNAQNIPKNNMGWDFGLNVEYPWSDNLDIGVDMVNIPVPFAAARLYHYMHLNSAVWVDTSELDITDLIEVDEDGNMKDIDLEDLRGTVYDYPDEFTPEYKYNADGKKIYRPFAMVLYANYRPFDSRFLSLIPSFGFSVNYLYPQPAAVEGGLSARFDTANMFITVLGIHYNDRRWVNSVDFIMNLRAVEFDLGISFQSQNFARSWQGAGLGINLGLKFGW
jgi:hypothetical protein